MDMDAHPKSIARLFNSDVYVIPTFQRPYAWERTQWDEFVEDIRNATSRTPPYHYFAPLHVVQIKSPKDNLWINYTNEENQDVIQIGKNNFRDTNRQNINVYLVIDGQQRLITFYMLLFQYIPMNITLLNGFQIPNIILNSEFDQVAFRKLLDLPWAPRSISHVSRAQNRLKKLFEKFQELTAKDTDFQLDNSCHWFFTGNDCKTLCVELDPSTRFAAFMTLNDRGKSLTNIEKTKSLFMEFDDNCPNPKPTIVNNSFGKLYHSLEAQDAYISDDEALRQIGMILWEGKNLNQISGVTWQSSSESLRGNSIHQIGSDMLYEHYFKKIPSRVSCDFLHGEFVQVLNSVSSNHDLLAEMISKATNRSLLHSPSFVQRLGITNRDAIEDYYNVLKSLSLHSKEIGFLLATKILFPELEWHDPLGTYLVDNTLIKDELYSIAGKIENEYNNYIGSTSILENIKNEIENIPDYINKEFNPLQIAEQLNLFIGNSKPGTFSTTWNNTFNNLSNEQFHVFLDYWCRYVNSYDSRYHFINKIATSSDAFNNNRWVPYLLKEYESTLSGSNAHENKKFEIEHFFPPSWAYDNYLSQVKQYGFLNCEEYDQSFVEKIGNKCILDQSLNRAIHNEEPLNKISAYQTHSWNHVQVMNTNPSKSAIEISNDLFGISENKLFRGYVELRSLRLAVFAARRF